MRELPRFFTAFHLSPHTFKCISLSLHYRMLVHLGNIIISIIYDVMFTAFTAIGTIAVLLVKLHKNIFILD